MRVPLRPCQPSNATRIPKCAGSNRPSESLQVDPSGGLANVVVYLEDIHAGKALQPIEADLNQVGCTYVPHVQAVPVGSTLNLLNGDPLLHNIHATQGASTAFNYAMPGSVRKIPKKLSRPGFLAIKCDVHGWMNGTVAVMDNPYFAVTDATGSFSIGEIPPGTYQLTIWHERLGKKSQPITIHPGEAAKLTLTMAGG